MRIIMRETSGNGEEAKKKLTTNWQTKLPGKLKQRFLIWGKIILKWNTRNMRGTLEYS